MSLLHRKPRQHRWVIVSGENRDWTCGLGPCLKAHAVSVLASFEIAIADQPAGTITLTGSATDASAHSDALSGTWFFGGSATDNYQPPGGTMSTIIQKLGTSGTAVMQKTAAGYTYITDKTGTAATAVMQKAASGWTKVQGH